jgi:hypothetical protein
MTVKILDLNACCAVLAFVSLLSLRLRKLVGLERLALDEVLAGDLKARSVT